MISVCILTLWRETIYQTLETIFLQEADFEYEIVIILQWEITTNRIDVLNKNNIKYHVHSYPHWLWFGFYRNKSIEHSLGDILVWIDDDEWAQNNHWLKLLVRPILIGEYQVVTSGCEIPLWQWYLSDCISLIGYPWWGALWFEKVWKVYKDSTTFHLCGGNFAVTRQLLNRVGFFEKKCIYSCDDTHLSWKIISVSEIIFYEPRCTLFHIARNRKNFCSWAQNRRKWMRDYYLIANNPELLSDKKKHILNIFKYLFKRPKYIPGFVYLIFLFFYSKYFN